VRTGPLQPRNGLRPGSCPHGKAAGARASGGTAAGSTEAGGIFFPVPWGGLLEAPAGAPGPGADGAG